MQRARLRTEATPDIQTGGTKDYKLHPLCSAAKEFFYRTVNGGLWVNFDTVILYTLSTN